MTDEPVTADLVFLRKHNVYMYKMIQTFFRMASKPKRRRTKSPDVPQNPPSQRLDTDVQNLARMRNLPEIPSNTVTADNCISENSFITGIAIFFSKLDQDQKKILLDKFFLLEIMMKQMANLSEIHVVGSIGEHVHFLEAYFNDVDVVFVVKSVVAFERHFVEEDCDYELCLQIDDTDTQVPGYIKLKEISKDQTDVPSFYSSYEARKETVDAHNNNRVVWNEVYQLLGQNVFSRYYFHNGPSCSTKFVSTYQHFDGVDIVYAIKCKEWPKIADEWLERRREYDWPAGSLMEEAVETGCFLVPVGGHHSRYKDLEWRISFVLAERLLIRRMNSIQRFVYWFIKTIKNVVFTNYSDIISSYIIKTTILWVSEENDVSNWQPSFVLYYIRLCFLKILNFFQADFCPNYFMRTCNLFHGKYSDIQKSGLVETITNFLNPSLFLSTLNNMESVQHAIEIMNATNQVTWNSLNIALCRHFCELITNIAVGIVFNKKEENNANFASKWLDHLLILVKNNRHNLSVVFQEILTENLSVLRVRAQAAVIYKNMQSSPEMLTKQQKFNSLRHLIEDHRLQVMGMSVGELIQIAHVFFSFGLLENCLHLVTPVLKMTLQKPQIRLNNNKSMFDLLEVLSESNEFDLAFSSPVRPVVNIQLYPFEFPMLTRDLLVECFALKETYNYYSEWDIGCSSFNVTLDPVVYACYLKFKCLRRIEKVKEAELALGEFEEMVDKGGISHRYIALNLLGCCLMDCGYMERAASMFLRSAHENKRRAATFFHILKLYLKVLSDEKKAKTKN